MSDIQEADHVKYAPFYRVGTADPKSAKSQTTSEVTAVHENPKKDDPEHKTYTIVNDHTGKALTYGKRNITEKLDG